MVMQLNARHVSLREQKEYECTKSKAKEEDWGAMCKIIVIEFVE
jgi:hypothetical protein